MARGRGKPSIRHFPCTSSLERSGRQGPFLHASRPPASIRLYGFGVRPSRIIAHQRSNSTARSSRLFSRLSAARPQRTSAAAQTEAARTIPATRRKRRGRVAAGISEGAFEVFIFLGGRRWMPPEGAPVGEGVLDGRETGARSSDRRSSPFVPPTREEIALQRKRAAPSGIGTALRKGENVVCGLVVAGRAVGSWSGGVLAGRGGAVVGVSVVGAVRSLPGGTIARPDRRTPSRLDRPARGQPPRWPCGRFRSC